VMRTESTRYGAVRVPPRSWWSEAGLLLFFFSSRRRHTRLVSDWSSDVCSSDLLFFGGLVASGLGGGVGQQAGGAAVGQLLEGEEIGRASCRERVEIAGGAGALKKKREEGRRERRGGREGERSEWDGAVRAERST